MKLIVYTVIISREDLVSTSVKHVYNFLTKSMHHYIGIIELDFKLLRFDFIKKL